MTIPSLPEVFTGERPRLLVQPQNGWANEPLPLGVMVEHASDGATVRIEGLPDGADLSLGSRADRFGWSVVAADLEQTYVGPPANFVGVIGPTATLRSASGTLLDRQPLRFQWRAKNGEPSDRPPVELTNYETASAGAPAATPTASPSPPQPVVALPPPASPLDTVGRALGSEAVASKRGARSKAPHHQSSGVLPDGKRSNALDHGVPSLGLFSFFSWGGVMGARPTQVQTQSSGKSAARRIDDRRVTKRAQ